MTNHINFLFGAGADAMYRIGAGATFVEPLLKSQYDQERKKLLGSNGKYRLVYRGSTKVFLQTIAANRVKAEGVFGKPITDKFCDYYEHKGANGTSFDEIKTQCQTWYDLLLKDETLLTSTEQTSKKFFLDNAVFFDVLDEKFNSLRLMPLNSNGARVINAYTTIFILLMNALYDISSSFEWTYTDIFNLLKKEYDKVDYSIDSYYSVLSKSKIDYEITTTNYTDVVQKVTKKDIAYLHGKMHWFEDYEHLSVWDCLIPNERLQLENNIATIFPFILIPSGVKPLICKREIKEFSKFVTQLDGSNYLCIVGYRFNSEDNHINSIISEWLRHPDHMLVYFNYDDGIEWPSIRWADSFKVEKKSGKIDEVEFISTLKSSADILDISVNSGNSLDCFKTLISSLEKIK